MLSSNVRLVVEKSGRFGVSGGRANRAASRGPSGKIVRGPSGSSPVLCGKTDAYSVSSAIRRSYVTRERSILVDGFDAPPMIDLHHGPASASVMTSSYDVKKEREQLVEDVKAVLRGEVPMNTLRAIGERQLSGASLRMWQRKVGDLEREMRIIGEGVAKDMKRQVLPDLETPVEFPDWITAIESVFRAAVYYQHEEATAHIPKTASFSHWNQMISDAQKREATRASLKQNLPGAIQAALTPSASEQQDEIAKLRFRSAIESYLSSTIAPAESADDPVIAALNARTPPSITQTKLEEAEKRHLAKVQEETSKEWASASTTPLSTLDKLIIASSPFAAVFQHNPKELVRFQQYMEAIDAGKEAEFIASDNAQRSATIAKAISARQDTIQHYNKLVDLAESAIVRLYLIKKSNAAIAIDTEQAQSLMQQLAATMDDPQLENSLYETATSSEADAEGAEASSSTPQQKKPRQKTKVDAAIEKMDEMMLNSKEASAQSIGSFRAALPSLISGGAANSAYDAQTALTPLEYTLWKQLDTVLERIQVACGESVSDTRLLISRDPSLLETKNVFIPDQKSDIEALAKLLPETGLDAKWIPFKTLKNHMNALLPVFHFSSKNNSTPADSLTQHLSPADYAFICSSLQLELDFGFPAGSLVAPEARELVFGEMMGLKRQFDPLELALLSQQTTESIMPLLMEMQGDAREKKTELVENMWAEGKMQEEKEKRFAAYKSAKAAKKSDEDEIVPESPLAAEAEPAELEAAALDADTLTATTSTTEEAEQVDGDAVANAVRLNQTLSVNDSPSYQEMLATRRAAFDRLMAPHRNDEQVVMGLVEFLNDAAEAQPHWFPRKLRFLTQLLALHEEDEWAAQLDLYNVKLDQQAATADSSAFDTLSKDWKFQTSQSVLQLAGVFGVTSEERANVVAEMTNAPNAETGKKAMDWSAVQSIVDSRRKTIPSSTAPSENVSALLPVGALAREKLKRVFGAQSKSYLRLLNERQPSSVDSKAEEALNDAQEKAQRAMWLDFSRDETGKLRNPLALYFPSSAEHPEGQVPIEEFMVDPHMRRVIQALARKIEDPSQWPQYIQRLAGHSDSSSTTASKFVSPAKPFGDGIALKDTADEADFDVHFSPFRNTLKGDLLKGEVPVLSDEDAAALKALLPPERSADVDALLADSKQTASVNAELRKQRDARGEDAYSELEAEATALYGVTAMERMHMAKRKQMLEGPYWRAATTEQRMRVIKTQEYLNKLAMQVEEGSGMIRVPKDSEMTAAALQSISPLTSIAARVSAKPTSRKSNSRFERALPGEKVAQQVDEEQEYLSQEEARPILESLVPLKDVLSLNDASRTSFKLKSSSSSKKNSASNKKSDSNNKKNAIVDRTAAEDLEDYTNQLRSTEFEADGSEESAQARYIRTREANRQQRLLDVRIAAMGELLQQEMSKLVEPLLTVKHKTLLDKAARGEVLDAAEETELETQVVAMKERLSKQEAPSADSLKAQAKVRALLNDIEFYSRDLVAEAKAKDQRVAQRDAAEKSYLESLEDDDADQDSLLSLIEDEEDDGTQMSLASLVQNAKENSKVLDDLEASLENGTAFSNTGSVFDGSASLTTVSPDLVARDQYLANAEHRKSLIATILRGGNAETRYMLMLMNPENEAAIPRLLHANPSNMASNPALQNYAKNLQLLFSLPEVVFNAAIDQGLQAARRASQYELPPLDALALEEQNVHVEALAKRLEAQSIVFDREAKELEASGELKAELELVDARVREEEEKIDQEIAARKQFLLKQYRAHHASSSEENVASSAKTTTTNAKATSGSASPSQEQLDRIVKVLDTVSKLPEDAGDAALTEALGFEVQPGELKFWNTFVQFTENGDDLNGIQGTQMVRPSSAMEIAESRSMVAGAGVGRDASVAAASSFIPVDADTLVRADETSVFLMAKRLAALTQLTAGGSIGKLSDSLVNGELDPAPSRLPLAIEDELHDMNSMNPFVRLPVDEVLLKEALAEEASQALRSQVSKVEGRELSEFDANPDAIEAEALANPEHVHPLLNLDMSDGVAVARYLSTLPDMFYGEGGARREALEEEAARESELHPAFFARGEERTAALRLQAVTSQRALKQKVLAAGEHLEAQFAQALEEDLDESKTLSHIDTLDFPEDVKSTLRLMTKRMSGAKKVRESKQQQAGELSVPEDATEMFSSYKDYQRVAHDLLSAPKSPEALSKLLTWATPEEMVKLGKHMLEVMKRPEASERTRALCSLQLQLMAHPIFHGGDVARAKQVSDALPIPQVESPGVKQLFAALESDGEQNEFVQIIHYLVNNGQLKEEEKTPAMRMFEESAMRGSAEDAKYQKWLKRLVRTGDLPRLGRELTRLGVFKDKKYEVIMEQLNAYKTVMKQEMANFQDMIEAAISEIRGEGNAVTRMLKLGERIAVHEAEWKTDYDLVEESGLAQGRKPSSDGTTLLWTKPSLSDIASNPNASSLRYFVDPATGFEYTVDLKLKKALDDAKKSDWQRFDESVGLGGVSGLMRESMSQDEMRTMLNERAQEEDAQAKGVDAEQLEAQNKYEKFFLTSTRDMAPVDLLTPERPVPLPGHSEEDVPTLREYMLREASLGRDGQVPPQTLAERQTVWQNGRDTGKSFWNAYDAVLHLDDNWDPLPALGDNWTLSEPNDPAINHWTHFSRYAEGALCLKINPSKFVHDGIEFQVERVAILLPEARRMFLSERVLNRVNLTRSNENEDDDDAIQLSDGAHPLSVKNQFAALLAEYDKNHANADPDAPFQITDDMMRVFEEHESGEFNKMDSEQNLELLKPTYPLIRQRLFDIPHNLLLSLKRVKWPHSQDLQSQYVRGFIPKPTEPDYPILNVPGETTPDTDPDAHIGYLGNWVKDAHRRLRVAIEHEQQTSL